MLLRCDETKIAGKENGINNFNVHVFLNTERGLKLYQARYKFHRN